MSTKHHKTVFLKKKRKAKVWKIERRCGKNLSAVRKTLENYFNKSRSNVL